MAAIRELLGRPRFKPILAAVAVVLTVETAIYAWRTLGPSVAASQSTHGSFICAETGRPFNLTLQSGMKVPVLSPYSGRNTGYPAEFCYWTKEGTVKVEPAPVLMNDWLGKHEPTYCPDCGRLVTPHSAVPGPGATPPPTREDNRNFIQH